MCIWLAYGMCVSACAVCSLDVLPVIVATPYTLPAPWPPRLLVSDTEAVASL
jgi:hypothetical protein